MSPAPCGRVVLCWLSLRRPFGRTPLSGACGVPALDGAGPPVVRVASAACCWYGSAAGEGGAEVDGSVAVVARDRGKGVVMVAVVLRGE